MIDPRDQLQQTLGSAYTLERELGGGGMSRVYLAQEMALGRQVVVKVIAPELAEGVNAERFAREVKLAARLQQANIVPVLAAGDADGLPYYTMPFVRGESLRARLVSGTPVPVNESIGILRDIARALAYAHAEGVIHRDIKPENILLSGGTAVVTDFGIAKALSASRTQDQTAATGTSAGLTQVGHSIGTPAYMAPEQAIGSPVDHRADLYAWGVVAYELLAGRHPFADRVGAQRMIAAHIAEAPPPLPAELSPLLVALVLQCLEKDPLRRPATADAIVTGLLTIGTPSAERVITATQAIRRPIVLRPLWIGAGVLVFALIATGLFWKSRMGTPDSRTVVVLPFENLGATEDAYFADGVTEEIASQIARIPGMQVIARASVQRFRGSERTPQDIARELGAAYALSGTVRWARGPGAGASGETQVRIVPALVRSSTGVQIWGEPYQEPLTDVFRVQTDVAERVALALSVTMGKSEQAALRRTDSRDPEARDAQLLGRALLRQRGLDNLRRAVVEFRRAIARDSTYARAWAGYSLAYGFLPAYFDSTVTWAASQAEAERAARRAVALDSLLPDAHAALAVALFHNVQLSAALASIDHAIALDPSAALFHKDRGEILLSQGRVSEAGEAMHRAVALDPLVPVMQADLAMWFVAARQYDSAMATITHTMELDPANPFWHFAGVYIAGHQGQLSPAIDQCVQFGIEESDCRLVWGGMLDPARRGQLLALLDSLPRLPKRAPYLLTALQALAYARLGVPDSAFARLRVALQPGQYEFYGVINSPWFDPIRYDPRWDQIVGRVQRR